MSEQIVTHADSREGGNSSFPAVQRTPAEATRPAHPVASFVEIWRVLRKRKRFIALSTISLFTLSVAYVLTTAPKFQATSVIEFNTQSSDSLSLESGRGMKDTNAMSYHVTQETEVRTLQSDTLALQVIRELNLEARPEFSRNQSLFDRFRKFGDESHLALEKAPHRRTNVLKAYHKNLRVEAMPGTRMIRVSFLSPDPEVAASVVNTLVADYQDQTFRIRYAATAQASDWLSKQLGDLKGQVETSRRRLHRRARDHGV